MISLPSSMANVTESLSAEAAGECGSWGPSKLSLDFALKVMLFSDPLWADPWARFCESNLKIPLERLVSKGFGLFFELGGLGELYLLYDEVEDFLLWSSWFWLSGLSAAFSIPTTSSSSRTTILSGSDSSMFALNQDQNQTGMGVGQPLQKPWTCYSNVHLIPWPTPLQYMNNSGLKIGDTFYWIKKSQKNAMTQWRAKSINIEVVNCINNLVNGSIS